MEVLVDIDELRSLVMGEAGDILGADGENEKSRDEGAEQQRRTGYDQGEAPERE